MGLGPIFLNIIALLLLLASTSLAAVPEDAPCEATQSAACPYPATDAATSADSLVQAQAFDAIRVSFKQEVEDVLEQVNSQHEDSKRSLALEKAEYEHMLKEQVHKTKALLQAGTSLREQIQAQDVAQAALLDDVKDLQFKSQRMRDALRSYADMLQTARRFAAAARQEGDEKALQEVALVEQSIAPPTVEALLEVAGHVEAGNAGAAAPVESSAALALLQQNRADSASATGAAVRSSSATQDARHQSDMQGHAVGSATAAAAAANAAAAQPAAAPSPAPAADADSMAHALQHALSASLIAGVDSDSPANPADAAEFVEELSAGLQEVQRAQRQGRQVLKARFLSLAEEQQQRYSQVSQDVEKLNETLSERKRQNVALSEAKGRLLQTHDALDHRFVALSEFLRNLTDALGSVREANVALSQKPAAGAGQPAPRSETGAAGVDHLPDQEQQTHQQAVAAVARGVLDAIPAEKPSVDAKRTDGKSTAWSWIGM